MLIEILEKDGGSRVVSANHVAEVEDRGSDVRVVMVGTGAVITEELVESVRDRINAARAGEVVDVPEEPAEPIE